MKVNSYTIFGDRQKWAPNFATNIRQHLAMYPDWTFWVHTDAPLEGGYLEVLKALWHEGIIRVTVVPDEGRTYQMRRQCMQMLWRMLPLWQETEYVFCRDLDSILTPRQLQFVRSFISSGETAHGINDNAAHNIELMGGMCGFQTLKFLDAVDNRSFEQLVKNVYDEERWGMHGTDQAFLMECIWLLVKGHSLVHQIEGDNDRSGQKIVTGADISDVPEAIREQGDDFTNYIGAQGTATDHRKASYSLGEICDFYDEHCERCLIVREIEDSLQWTTTRTEGIFTVRNHSMKTTPTTSTKQSELDSVSSVT